MSLAYYQVDAFTETPFTGNPAAICPLSGPVADAWMQQLANEMNLSETAFCYPEADGWRLRWFTPSAEVDLCGHATLATAHILHETGQVTDQTPIVFHTRSGVLHAWTEPDGWVLDFPAQPPRWQAVPTDVQDCFAFPISRLGLTPADYLIEMPSEAELRRLRPDFTRLASLPVRGVIVTAASADPAFDFVSRFFAPSVGVPEDPVTGSAHCALGPYWAQQLGNHRLRAFQASSRGGMLTVDCQGDRVHLIGQAVTVARGEVLVPAPAAGAASGS